MTQRIAVIGGGWAGLAAAVEAVRSGRQVTLFEMAPRLGGRARSLEAPDAELDNGQHILIGAYVETLALMTTIGVDPEQAMLRTPLRLVDAAGVGLKLATGSPFLAFGAAVMRQRGWKARDRLALLAAAAGWTARGFRCDARLTVDQLTRGLPAAIRVDLIEPLCVAALNTSADAASAVVFLRVLKDALFAGAGSADLLLPRVGLSEMLPDPAQKWLQAASTELHLKRRVGSIEAARSGWAVDGEVFDQVVIATSAVEAARLTRDLAPEWSLRAAALRYEPIITVYLQGEGVRLPEPMLTLLANEQAPAQFVFDRGHLGGPTGLLAFVISGAQAWVDRGTAATVGATLRQAHTELAGLLTSPLSLVKTLTEKRATFRSTPDLARPSMRIATNLHAAGDHVSGPYPATLEGAVRSGLDAIRAFA